MEETEEKCNINIDSDIMLNAQRNLARQGLTVSEFLQVMLMKAAENSVVIKSKED